MSRKRFRFGRILVGGPGGCCSAGLNAYLESTPLEVLSDIIILVKTSTA